MGGKGGRGKASKAKGNFNHQEASLSEGDLASGRGGGPHISNHVGHVTEASHEESQVIFFFLVAGDLCGSCH